MERVSVAEVVERAADEVVSPEAVGLFAFAAVDVENEQLVLVNSLDYRLAQGPCLHDPDRLRVESCIHL